MEILQTILLQLKHLGCCGIKISFEDEGALLNEVITMRYLTALTGLDLSIKIGGSEAKRDIVDCIDIGCDSIVVPMIESSFALKKFLNSLNQYGYSRGKGFNLETINAYNCLEELSSSFDKIDYVTVGRHDLVSSLNQDKNYVNSDEVYNIVSNVFKKAKECNIQCYMGGSLCIKSKDFIEKLIEQKLLDKFETRYVIFDVKKIDYNNIENIIHYANIFESEWLKYISRKYSILTNKDSQRIISVEDKIKNYIK